MIAVNSIVSLKGTKSRGDNWDIFLSNFKEKKKEDLYGKVFAISGREIWIHIFDKATGELLDKSTWGFMKEDLEENE